MSDTSITVIYHGMSLTQSVPKTFRQTSPNSILEEFFLFD